VVFGEVVKGIEVIKELEKLGNLGKGAPHTLVGISGCGEITSPAGTVQKNPEMLL
jgi:hypothetical protein